MDGFFIRSWPFWQELGDSKIRGAPSVTAHGAGTRSPRARKLPTAVSDHAEERVVA
jgi:hypothetical protein